MLIKVLEDITPLFVALCAMLGVRYSSKVSAKATQDGAEMQNELNWRQQFQKEIAELKERIEKIEEENWIRGKRLNILGDFLDALSLYLLYDRTGPFPEPPEGGAEEHYERGRYMTLRDRYESEEAAAQQRFQNQQ